MGNQDNEILTVNGKAWRIG